MKKFYYFLAVIFVTTFLIVGGFLLLSNDKSSATEQTTITIQPNTLKEQKELADAEEREEAASLSGPLVAFTSVPRAESKVLNLQRK